MKTASPPRFENGILNIPVRIEMMMSIKIMHLVNHASQCMYEGRPMIFIDSFSCSSFSTAMYLIMLIVL